MRISFLICLAAISVSVLSSGTLLADEVSDVLAVEDIPGTGSAPAAVPTASAGAKAPVGQGTTTQVAGVTGMDITLLLEALQKKDVALKDAQKEIERLRGYIEKIVEANRRERVVMHYNLGCIFKAAKQITRAKEEFLKAVEIDPNDPGVHYNLAILYDDDLNDKKNAKKHYEKFLELAPNDRDAPKVREWIVSLP